MTFPTRRRFLQTAGISALATSCSPWLTADTAPIHRRRLRIAQIGVGNKGFVDLKGCAATGEDIVALCDVDFDRGAKGFRQFPLAARYRDYRHMLDDMGDKIDAVVVSTPDHTHFPAALMAIERGKHVYVQKPLTHTIGEARQLKVAAAKAGIVTQMGNQGHANEGTRLIKEWIEAGVLGQVREIHSWTDRPIWPQGHASLPTPVSPIPDTLDWNLWLGTAPFRDYSPEIVPWVWRGWWDYGCGGLGDMGCHLMDAPFWALDLRGDVTVSAVSEGNSKVSAPTWSIVTYEFPARGVRPPTKYVWYDGAKQPTLPAEFNRVGELPTSGTLYVGDEGALLASGAYSQSVRLLPESKMRSFTNRPPKTIPRVERGDPYLEWINACRGQGPNPGSNIVHHSADLTEFVLLGNLAIRLGKTISWDSARGECRGMPEATPLLQPSYRLF